MSPQVSSAAIAHAGFARLMGEAVAVARAARNGAEKIDAGEAFEGLGQR